MVASAEAGSYDRLRVLLQGAAPLPVPTTVQHELYKWVKRESDETRAPETIALATESLDCVTDATVVSLQAVDRSLLLKMFHLAGCLRPW